MTMARTPTPISHPQSEDVKEPTAPAPAAPVEPEQVPQEASDTASDASVSVRVISASHGHKVDAIVQIPAAELDAAVSAGWADPSPAAIAEAYRLHAIPPARSTWNWTST
jgi:hypothetical protein